MIQVCEPLRHFVVSAVLGVESGHVTSTPLRCDPRWSSALCCVCE
jgi:hypothetical protein